MVDLKRVVNLTKPENNYKYPAEVEVAILLDEGYSILQSVLGFGIFNYNGYGLLNVESIGAFNYDEDAAREAERIGYCKIIPVDELPYNFYIDGHDAHFFGWVDTPDNRKAIKEYCKKLENESKKKFNLATVWEILD